MIITLKNANFSLNNIGSLSDWRITTILGAGCVYTGPKSVAKDTSLAATVIVNEAYSIKNIVITMNGVVQSSAYNIKNNNVSVSIAKVTGNISISIDTVVKVDGGTVDGDTIWYLDHRDQGSALTMSVNKAGRGWCHENNAAFAAYKGKPVNTIAFFTNQPSQEVTVGKIKRQGSVEELETIAVVTATIPSNVKQLCTITFPTVTLADDECLVLFCQEDDNIQFYYTTGNLVDANGISGGGFHGRVPKVYGTGSAWQAMGMGYSLGWSIGYNSSLEEDN